MDLAVVVEAVAVVVVEGAGEEVVVPAEDSKVVKQ